MSSRDGQFGDDPVDPLVAEFRREKAREERSYRARALKLLPHICAHCGREFEGRRLRELTVHHKDVDPTNNPPDGSNWELLCLYCHDNEHGHDAAAAAAARTDDPPAAKRKVTGLHQPFAELADLLKKRNDDR